MRVLSKAWRYGLAVISCGIALAVAMPLDSPSSCFFLAVMVSARRARRREQAIRLVLILRAARPIPVGLRYTHKYPKTNDLSRSPDAQ